jgi:TldD protein
MNISSAQALPNPVQDNSMTTHSLDSAQSPLALATELLLTPNGLDESHLLRALAEIQARRADYADLYFEYTCREGRMLDEGVIKGGGYARQQGLGVRVVAGERSALAHTHLITPAALTRAALASRTIAADGSARDTCALDGFARPAQAQLYLPHDPLASLDEAAKVAILKQVDRLARAADRRVTRVNASLSAEWTVVLIARSDGRIVADVRPMVALQVVVTARMGARAESTQSSRSARADYTMFSPAMIAACVGEAVAGVQHKLEAKEAPAGQLTVVIAGGTGGVMLHEAVGHGLEGDFNRKGQSLFAGRIGERVAAPGVTLVDDGTLPGLRGSLNVDDEGTPAGCTTLIEDGILKGYMQDTLNARLMGMSPTGNSRRQSYAHMPMPRMTNTYMLAGAHDPQEVIASVEKGLYVTTLGGGQVDITNGSFVFTAEVAYLIENGRIGAPVRGATLVGNGPQTMQQVSMIGNDLSMDPTGKSCGKAGQTLPVGVGQPTLRIDRMTVGGTA